MDNLEKLATKGPQDEEIQIKNTTQYVMDTTKLIENEVAILKKYNYT